MQTSPPRDDKNGRRRTGRRALMALIALGVLGLLAAAAWVALRHAYPPARLASMLAERVSTATGRDFRIEGDLNLRLVPTFAIEATDVVLASPKGSSHVDTLRARQVAFAVSLRELLAGTLRILSVDAQDADIGLPTGQILRIESLALAAKDPRSRLTAELAFGPQHWKVEGEVGPVEALLAGSAEWPLDLRASTEGASLEVQGSMGTGTHIGAFDAKVSVRVDAAPALTPFGPAAQVLPVPLEWHATVVHAPTQWRADPMALSMAGQHLTGNATLKLGAAVPLQLEAALSAATLSIPPLPAISALQARVSYEPGRLQVEPFSFAIAGGQARGQLRVALRPEAAPRIDLQLSARSMSVEALDTAHPGGRRFRGGRADVEAKLAMSGRTPAALAASSSGSVLLSARDVGLAGRAAALDRDVLSRLIEALIPSSMPRDNLVVQCAVARLPLRNGVAAIDRSIAVETRQIAVSASGEINLARQTLSLAFRPQVKRGLDLNPGSLVGLLVLQGPFDALELSINPRGAVHQAANVGVAAATGGISLLAPVLRNAAGEPSACDHAASPARPQAGPGRSPAKRDTQGPIRRKIFGG
ncbi:AsmA family protein [Variovorax sp. M-6]|uniref:AsmA family protein n=1 Tax=Variovorax sp. M-6 TaxID=3233041 RepID=UPI003F9A3D12